MSDHLQESTPTTVALVTGANKGLGLETVRRLSTLGWTVWLGSRDPARGESAAAHVRDLVPGADVRPLALDVTSDDSVRAAYDVVAAASGRLDVLVNNAGVAGGLQTPAETGPADFLPVYGVNLLGPVRTTQRFLPLLARSAQPRLVMVSSGMGSFALTTDPDRLESTLHNLVYSSSKAALNMVTTQYAKSLPGVVPGIRVTAVDPGYTATDLNDHSGVQSVEEGTDAVVQACTAELLDAGFLDRRGAVAW